MREQLSRRSILAAGSASLAAWGLSGSFLGEAGGDEPRPPERRKRLAVVTTVWRNRSHAWHMAERFLHGYPRAGKWYRPPIEVVSAYVDQQPEGDLSKGRAEEFGFKIYPNIADALRCGGKELAVDAVLIIGEHGDYPKTDFGQTKYPRYAFFRAVAEVYQQEKKPLPTFNDKHLSWDWDLAKDMYDIARELKIPFSAGSSLPVTWRMPSVDLPWQAEVEEMLCVAFGGVDSYDFHALEVLQCMAERRRGGETGVAAVQGLRGAAVWKLLETKGWSEGGLDPRLFEACLARTQTLQQPETFSHRYPTPAQMRDWVKDPVAYRIEYRDGMQATMLLLNGLVSDFTFAARLKGEPEPLSTLFYLPPVPNVTYSAALMAQAEATFLTGKSPSPIERTLLTTGLVQAGVRSLGTEQKRLETPHLGIRYAGVQESLFLRN